MTKRYSKGFKEEALSLAQETSVGNASEKLGVANKTLYAWRQAKRLCEAPEITDLTLEKQNKALRRENEELRQANTILKKALGFFAKG
ncbi:MAG: transposase [Clostridia bacterium]